MGNANSSLCKGNMIPPNFEKKWSINTHVGFWMATIGGVLALVVILFGITKSWNDKKKQDRLCFHKKNFEKDCKDGIVNLCKTKSEDDSDVLWEGKRKLCSDNSISDVNMQIQSYFSTSAFFVFLSIVGLMVLAHSLNTDYVQCKKMTIVQRQRVGPTQVTLQRPPVQQPQSIQK